MPSMKCRWPRKNRMIIGTVVITLAVTMISQCHSPPKPNWSSSDLSPRGTVKSVASRAGRSAGASGPSSRLELEERRDDQRRPGQRQRDAPEDRPVAGAVDAGGLEQLARAGRGRTGAAGRCRRRCRRGCRAHSGVRVPTRPSAFQIRKVGTIVTAPGQHHRGRARAPKSTLRPREAEVGEPPRHQRAGDGHGDRGQHGHDAPCCSNQAAIGARARLR